MNAHTALSTPVSGRRAEGATPSPERIYAIGDVHGRADLFAMILRAIQRDGRTRGASATKIIILGDLIDRGPRSRDMIEMVRRFDEGTSGVVTLRGNHEELLVRSAAGSDAAQRIWFRNGGAATLLSFGLHPDRLRGLSAPERARRITEAVGTPNLEWIRALPTHFISGDYFFCHAGIRPGLDLNKQRTRDLLWIRDEFLKSEVEHGAIIVHGHAETKEPEIRHNRINIDTAAYRTGRLTAIGLEGPERWILSVEQK